MRNGLEDAVRVGLIARANQRGTGIQSHEFYLNMAPAKTLVVMMRDTQFPDDPGLYQGPNVDFIEAAKDRHLNEDQVRKFMRDLDVMFAVETLYEWELANWARELGVRTVVQGNPEFYVHNQQRNLASPDVWAWPTDWMLEQLPEGPSLPVPVPEYPPALAGDPNDEVLQVLHVAGHAALGDRNGTIDFMESLRHIQTPVRVTVVSQDGWLPDTQPSRKVELTVIEHGVLDRWSMYDGQHLVVLPRRYGGLCLPCQEALAVGCAVAMTDCSPNRMWPIIPMERRLGRQMRVPMGVAPTSMVRASTIAATIDELNRDREQLQKSMMAALSWAAGWTWDTWRPRYDAVLGGEM